jgi:hypothetical protein
MTSKIVEQIADFIKKDLKQMNSEMAINISFLNDDIAIEDIKDIEDYIAKRDKNIKEQDNRRNYLKGKSDAYQKIVELLQKISEESI